MKVSGAIEQTSQEYFIKVTTILETLFEYEQNRRTSLLQMLQIIHGVWKKTSKTDVCLRVQFFHLCQALKIAEWGLFTSL